MVTNSSWEVLADVHVLLEGLTAQDSIICYCTRSTVLDRDLLRKGMLGEDVIDDEEEEVVDDDDVSRKKKSKRLKKQEQEFLASLAEGIVEFPPAVQKTLIQDAKKMHKEKKKQDWKRINFYKEPLVEYEGDFQHDLEVMKEMGLPLAFCTPTQDEEPEDKLVRLKGAKNKKRGNKKKHPGGDKKNAKNNSLVWLPADEQLEQEFEEYWNQNGHQIVLDKWNHMYGDYVQGEDDLGAKEPSVDNVVGLDSGNSESSGLYCGNVKSNPEDSVIWGQPETNKDALEGVVDPGLNRTSGNSGSSGLNCGNVKSNPEDSVMWRQPETNKDALEGVVDPGLDRTGGNSESSGLNCGNVKSNREDSVGQPGQSEHDLGDGWGCGNVKSNPEDSVTWGQAHQGCKETIEPENGGWGHASVKSNPGAEDWTRSKWGGQEDPGLETDQAAWNRLWQDHWQFVYKQEHEQFILNRSKSSSKQICEDLSREILNMALGDDKKELSKDTTKEETWAKVQMARQKSGVGIVLQALQNQDPKDSDNQDHQTKPGHTSPNVDSGQAKNVSLPGLINSSRINSDNGSDDDPPEEKPIDLKRSHQDDSTKVDQEEEEDVDEVEEEEVGFKHIRDLGYVFKPGNQFARHPDTPEVRGASVYFKSKDVIKRTRRLNFNKKSVLDKTKDFLKDKESSNEEFLTAEESLEEFQDAPEVVPVQPISENKKGRKKKKKKLVPPEDLDPELTKYWYQRYRLFSRFDSGIRFDSAESWFSVTPEKIAKHLAERLRCDLIVDGFCGVGGNAIQFALTCSHVIAVDIDAAKIEAARHNAKIYGVEDRIEFIVGNYFHIMPHLYGADVVFLSPPWGSPDYLQQDTFDLKTMVPIDDIKVFDTALQVTENIAYYVPKNTNVDQLISLARSRR